MRYIDLEDFADALEEYTKNLRKALADANYADSTVEVPSCDDTNAVSKFIGNGFKIGHLWNDLGMKTRDQKEKEEYFNAHKKKYSYEAEDHYGHVWMHTIWALSKEDALKQLDYSADWSTLKEVTE